MNDVAASAPPARTVSFTFGDPVPVLESGGILDYVHCWQNGRYYEPPVSLDGLSRATRANVYLGSGLRFKTNMLVRSFKPNKILSREAFEQFAMDWVHFGMGYLERRNSVIGNAVALVPALAKYMRRGVEPGTFYQVRGWKDEHEFEPGSVFQLREADVNQEIYGLPEWMPSLQSALLNESATLFRRKYYNNGSHAGFILYLTDEQVDDADVDALRESLKSTRGVGNFRNLFLHSPSGKKDGLQLIPVSEVAAKDEFTGIKSVTRDDVLASLRIPPQLLGVVPQNAGGFGSIRDAYTVWGKTELAAMQTRMLRVNDWIGQEVIAFDAFDPEALGGAA